ncbi:MAG: hypothetical protein ACFCGT_10855 [Sandaracinaceae bacterium]
MDALASAEHLVDFALAVIALELVLLLTWGRRAASRLRPPDLVGQLLAGGLLLLAVRLEMVDADRGYTVGVLLLSLPAHLFDLWRRVRSGRPPAGGPGGRGAAPAPQRER